MNRRKFLTAGGASLILPFLGIGRAFATAEEEKAKMQALAGNIGLSPARYLVGEKATMVFTYSVGDLGLKKNGTIKLLIPIIWSLPQNNDPTREGYTVCELGDMGKLVLEEHVPENTLTITLTRDLNPGEKITIVYGDKSRGDGGARLTDFPWDDLAFPLIVDYDGTGTRIGKLLTNPVMIVAGTASRTRIFVPATSRVQENVWVKTSVGDSYFNFPEPRVNYTTKIKKQPDMDVLPLVKGEEFIPVRFKKPGMAQIIAIVEANEYPSSKIKVQDKKAPYNLYFGDLHGHSLGSDGLHSPEDYLAYGREMSGLDICILTDHAECIYDENKYNWNYLIKAAEDAYRSGQFVTYPAFEWTHGTWGHRCVYYRDATIATNTGYFNCSYENANTPAKLYELVRNAKPIIIPHHTMAAYKWEQHDPELEPLVEIYSMWGSSEYNSNPLWTLKLKGGSSVSQGLNLGYQLGFVGAGDNHHGQPAQGLLQSKFIQLDHANGISGIWAEELTRVAIWKALKERRTFATTGVRMVVDFRINEQPMGSIIQSSGNDQCRWRVRGTDRIQSLEIVTNDNKNIYEETDIKSDEIKGNFTIMPTEENKGKTSFYYLRIKQADNNWAWTSPVWINKA